MGAITQHAKNCKGPEEKYENMYTVTAPQSDNYAENIWNTYNETQTCIQVEFEMESPPLIL